MNKLQMLLMSRLENKPMTGYELTKSINTGHSHQQVYRELRVLESKGNVTHEVIDSCNPGKPKKKVYSKTNAPSDSFGEHFSLSDFTKTNVAFHIDAIGESCSDYVKVMLEAEANYLKGLKNEESN